MTALQTLRRRSGLFQRALARRAGLAFRTVQLMEAGGHDTRWSTLKKLATALGTADPRALLPTAAAASFCAADAADHMRAEGGDSWKLWLFEFVDAFRASPRPEAAARPPDPGLEPRPLALLALEKSVATPVTEPRDLSGIIKDFEIVYELSWKTLKTFLETQGHESASARDAFSRAYQLRYLDGQDAWLAREMAERIRASTSPLSRTFSRHCHAPPKRRARPCACSIPLNPRPAGSSKETTIF